MKKSFFIFYLLLMIPTSILVWAEDFSCPLLFQFTPSIPMKSHPDWIKETIYPKLTNLRENYLQDIQESHSQLERLLDHRLFTDFSGEYITNIEYIMTDILLQRRSDTSLKIQIEINYLISILSKINLKYQTKEFNPSLINNNHERTAYFLLNSISKLMSSDELHYSLWVPKTNREAFAKTQQKVALIILSKITTLNRSSTYYFMSYDPQLMNLLLESSKTHHSLALKAIRNLCSSDSDQITVAISKLVEKDWKYHEVDFYNLIKLLHDSVEHNRTTQLNPGLSISLNNDLISQQLNAPIRDLEMNMINIIKKQIKNTHQEQAFDKTFVLLNIFTEKQIPPSSRNLDLLIDILAEGAAHYLSPNQEKKLDQFLSNLSSEKKEYIKIYDSYLQMKQEKLDQININPNEDDIIFF